MALAGRFEPSGELGQRGGFTRALKPDHHDFDGRFDLQVELARLPAHRPRQFVGDELDEMLLRGERTQDFLAQRLLLYVVDEVADYPDVDVGFEQGKAHLAQRVFDISLGNSALTAKLLEDAFEP